MSRKVFCVQCERYTRQGRCECNPSLSGQYDGDPYGAWKRAAEKRNSMSGGAMSGLALCEHRMPKGECHVSHCPDARLADSYLVAAPAPRGAPGDEDAGCLPTCLRHGWPAIVETVLEHSLSEPITVEGAIRARNYLVVQMDAYKRLLAGRTSISPTVNEDGARLDWLFAELTSVAIGAKIDAIRDAFYEQSEPFNIRAAIDAARTAVARQTGGTDR